MPVSTGLRPIGPDNLLLGVKKVRAYEVLRELEEAEGPDQWFVQHALRGMRDGKITRGQETEASKKMCRRLLHEPQGGGFQYLRYYHNMFIGNKTVDLDQLRKGKDEVHAEVLDYLVYSKLIWRFEL